MNTGPMKARSPVIFEPEIAGSLPDDLHVASSLLILKGGKSSKVSISVTNDTKSKIVLEPHTILGQLQLVHSVSPLNLKLNETQQATKLASTTCTEVVSNTNARKGTAGEDKSVFEKLDLSTLNDNQKHSVVEMLEKQKDVFSINEDDIGCIEEFQMKINLSNAQPVQKRYCSILVFYVLD